FDALNHAMDQRFGTFGHEMGQRFDTLGRMIDDRFATVDQQFVARDARFARLETKTAQIAEMDVWLERLETKTATEFRYLRWGLGIVIALVLGLVTKAILDWLIPNCGELDSSWPTSALERCAHISLDHCTFLQWMSRWNSRRMSQGLRVLV